MIQIKAIDLVFNKLKDIYEVKLLLLKLFLGSLGFNIFRYQSDFVKKEKISIFLFLSW